MGVLEPSEDTELPPLDFLVLYDESLILFIAIFFIVSKTATVAFSFIVEFVVRPHHASKDIFSKLS